MRGGAGLVALAILLSASLGSAEATDSLVFPELRFSPADDGDCGVRWSSLARQRYQLESSTSLNEFGWLPIGSQVAGTGSEMSWTGPMDGSRRFYRLQVNLPEIRRIAFMGDSITAQGSTDLTNLWAVGYANWARVFGGSRWEMEPNGTTLRFATGGKASGEVSSLHLAQVIASNADACVVAYGTNDAFRLYSTASFVSQAVSDWTALRGAGIEPIAVTVLPMGSVGGENAARQARVAEYNAALRIAAAQHGVILCDWTTVLEAEPGSNNGVGLDSYFINNDNLHPNSHAAAKLGRVLGMTVSAHFGFPTDVWENANWITPNVAFSGTSGQEPSQWNLYPPMGSTVNSKSLTSSPEGTWFELDISPGTSTGNFNLISFAANTGGSPASKTVETLVEVQVLAGSLDLLCLQTNSGGAVATELQAGSRLGSDVVPADGVVVLRTPLRVLGATATSVLPSLYFNAGESNTVVRFRRCGVRVVD